MMRHLLGLCALILALACSSSSRADGTVRAAPLARGQAEAIFAGGCFWCMEAPFERLDGVVSVHSGYIGGRTNAPSYEEVSAGSTGHAEAVRIVYDPARVTYEQLLEVFWHNVDPTQADGQFCDHGDQYRTGIFVVNDEQRRLATASLANVRRALAPRRVVTGIEDAGPFWVAEDYHQDFHVTHPARYQSYRIGCGRDRRLREVWGEAAAH
jgi:peptide-methionine (S)-S-oxide reductase